MADPRLVIGLNAVLAALDGPSPQVLCVARDGGIGLPFGAFDPTNHRTFELGLRDFVAHQAAVPLGYVEQLYTFGDQGRERPRARFVDGDLADRVISVGYLALAPTTKDPTQEGAAWHDWYEFFPWEDWREKCPALLTEQILPALREWANGDEDRCARIRASFGGDEVVWQEERVLERYEIIYEAGLVEEAFRDRSQNPRAAPLSGAGTSMISDHRRILATAIGRLRGKLRYRPIIFEMMPEDFTLTDLQSGVETILGFAVHKQNFRRSLQHADLVRKTGESEASTGGRPAALFARSDQSMERYAPGLTLPRIKAGFSAP